MDICNSRVAFATENEHDSKEGPSCCICFLKHSQQIILKFLKQHFFTHLTLLSSSFCDLIKKTFYAQDWTDNPFWNNTNNNLSYQNTIW